MFLEFPGSRGMLDPMPPSVAAAGRLMNRMRFPRLLLLPLLLVTLGMACHHGSSNNTASPGTPPVITGGPTDASTITGRPVTFEITATGAPTLRYQWAKDGVDILGAIHSALSITSPKVQDAGRYVVTVTNPNGTLTSSSATLTVLQAVTFTTPVGVVTDASGNLFVSDTEDHTLWKVDAAHQKTLLAGSSGLAGSADGIGNQARFDHPGGIALDPAGNLVVADTGNHTIRRIAPDGTVTTLAGSPGLPGAVDGLGPVARFRGPNGLVVTPAGTMYIADSQNHTIRFMALDGTITTYAGTAGMPGLANGAGAGAQFNQPTGLALAPDGSLYVADYGNSCIRLISPALFVSTFAGAPTHGFQDGSATTAQFYLPMGIALDSAGVLWVVDTRNHAIRRVKSDGTVSLFAGSGTLGNADGTGTLALFSLPGGIAITPSGNLLVADTQNHILRSITPAAVVTSLTTP